MGDYCIDSTEVSGAHYAEFLASSPRVAGQAEDCAFNAHFEPQALDSEEILPAFEAGRQNFPVSHVDFCDARAYCAWAGKRLCGDKGGGPLPASEREDLARSEWGSACAGSAGRQYPYGDQYVPGRCAVVGSYHDVGSVPACEGGFDGVFDLIGNVWEWENSCEAGSLETASCSRRGGAVLVMPESWACADAGDPSRGSLRQGDMGIRCCSD